MLAHYRANAADGAGLPLGRQPNGSALVAVRATPEGWRAWLADVGTERREMQDDSGRVTGESVTYRHPGRHTLVTWSPPPLRARSVTAFGAALINEATRAVTSPRQQPAPTTGVAAWTWRQAAVWATPGVPDGTEDWQVAGQTITRPRYRPVTFPVSKRLAHGVDVLSAGVVPWHLRREDGWTLSASGIPVVEPLPTWLLTALGGQVAKKER